MRINEMQKWEGSNEDIETSWLSPLSHLFSQIVDIHLQHFIAGRKFIHILLHCLYFREHGCKKMVTTLRKDRSWSVVDYKERVVVEKRTLKTFLTRLYFPIVTLSIESVLQERTREVMHLMIFSFRIAWLTRSVSWTEAESAPQPIDSSSSSSGMKPENDMIARRFEEQQDIQI